MKQYLELVQKIANEGILHPDRTGTGRIKIPFAKLEFDLQEGFPLVTTRKVNPMLAFQEMLYFISGETNVQKLEDKGVNFWKRWTAILSNGFKSIGPMYGVVWRGTYKEDGVDQLKNLADDLKNNPYSSRLCVTAWIPELLPKDLKDPKANAKHGLGVLAPCHCFYQVVPIQKNNEWTLNLQIYIRSSDVPVGLPFNIAQYAFLAHLLANHAGMKVGKLSVVLGDAHIYADQLEDCKIQLQRTPRPLPTFKLADYAIGKSIFDIVSTDFVLINVNQDEAISYKVST